MKEINVWERLAELRRLGKVIDVSAIASQVRFKGDKGVVLVKVTLSTGEIRQYFDADEFKADLQKIK